MDTTFAQSKKEMTYSRKEKEYEKYLGVMESIRTLILQALHEPYLEALKKKYICHCGILPTTMIHHLRSKTSKFTSQDKTTVKCEIFISWEQPTFLLAYFKKIETAKKKLEELNVTVFVDDIVIHVMEQMYDSDLFTEGHMTKWEEREDRNKSWEAYNMHFKWC